MKSFFTIKEICHIDKNNEIIWSTKDLKNIIHHDGENFAINALFNTSTVSVPTSYYVGLDNRTSVTINDVMSGLVNEPTQFGYSRVSVSSSSGFTIDLNDSDIYEATTSVLTFTASGGDWGPVRNAFITNVTNNSGYLIASIAINSPTTVHSGEKLTMKLQLNLKNV